MQSPTVHSGDTVGGLLGLAEDRTSSSITLLRSTFLFGGALAIAWRAAIVFEIRDGKR